MYWIYSSIKNLVLWTRVSTDMITESKSQFAAIDMMFTKPIAKDELAEAVKNVLDSEDS